MLHYDTRSPRAVIKAGFPLRAGPRGPSPGPEAAAPGVSGTNLRPNAPPEQRHPPGPGFVFLPQSRLLVKPAPATAAKAFVTPAKELKKPQQITFKTSLLLNGQLCYNSFPVLRARGASACPPQRLWGVQGPRVAPAMEDPAFTKTPPAWI